MGAGGDSVSGQPGRIVRQTLWLPVFVCHVGGRRRDINEPHARLGLLPLDAVARALLEASVT